MMVQRLLCRLNAPNSEHGSRLLADGEHARAGLDTGDVVAASLHILSRNK
jgi:hypothetical protein